MLKRNHWYVGAFFFTLGGCIVGYPLDQYDSSESSASSVSASSSSGGGEGGSLNSSSSTGGGLGGSGGQGGANECPTAINCDDRPITGCDADCPVHSNSDRFGGPFNQLIRTVAIDSNGNFAVAGHYNQGPFSLDNAVDETKLPDSAVGNGTMFTEGFAGYYDAAGQSVWAESIGTPMTETGTGRSVFAAAFDSQDSLILVGSETPAVGAKPNLFIRKKLPTPTVGIPNDTWLIKRSIGGETTASIAWAVATDATDFYVLGTSTANATTITCANGPNTISTGPFVAKFNALGNCQWVRSFDTTDLSPELAPTAIYAKSAQTQGVWITGTSNKKLPVAPLNGELAAGMNETFGFVICLDSTTGAPTSAIKLTGTLKPEAISVLKDGNGINGNGTIVLAGGLTGVTSLNTNAVTAAAFVSVLDVKAPTSANTMIPGTFTHNTALFVSPTGSANATAVVLRNNRIHIAGTFSDSLLIPPMGMENVTRSGFLVPFVATLKSDTLAPLGVQAFTTESLNTANEKNVAIAGNVNKLVLAGTWAKAMNMSTRHDSMAGDLPLETGNVDAVDPFIAQYSITP